MAKNQKLEAVLRESIESVNPTSPPDELAESLRAIAAKHSLGTELITELITGYFSHFELDISGAPAMVILRSGYQIRAEGDIEKVAAHLKNAIVGESAMRFSRSGSGDFRQLWGEIASEVEHIAYKTHETSVRALLAQLLLESSHLHWGKLVNEMFPFLEVESLPPTDIPAFLQMAKKKLVLLLGKDTGQGLDRLQAIRKFVEAHGYQCQLIKEMPEHSEMGLIGKVLFSALSSRFVIIENSTASGHLYEIPFVRMAECVIAIMQREGEGATWMTEDMISKHPLLKKFQYTDDSLSSSVDEAIYWAEQRIAENIKANRGSWPWASQ